MTHTESQRLADELRNFEEIATALKPSAGHRPDLAGIEVYGHSIPLHGEIGGDHLIYVDFEQRYDIDRRIDEATVEGRPEVAANLERLRERAGVLLADVSGHRITDGLIAAMLHQAFLLGVCYELDRFGQITTRLFEHLNQRFYQTTHVRRYVTMVYGEISRAGRFRFIAAGHPPPRVFSRRHGRFVDVPPDRLVAFPPVGMFPSEIVAEERVTELPLGPKEGYRVNEIDLLAAGDLILLHTDGLSEHADHAYFPARVERLFAEHADRSADEIGHRLADDLTSFAEPTDDVSFVLIRRKPPGG